MKVQPAAIVFNIRINIMITIIVTIMIKIIIIVIIIIMITITIMMMIKITLILTNLHDPRRSPGLQGLHKVCVPFLPVSDGGDESGGNDGGDIIIMTVMMVMMRNSCIKILSCIFLKYFEFHISMFFRFLNITMS